MIFNYFNKNTCDAGLFNCLEKIALLIACVFPPPPRPFRVHAFTRLAVVSFPSARDPGYVADSYTPPRLLAMQW